MPPSAGTGPAARIAASDRYFALPKMPFHIKVFFEAMRISCLRRSAGDSCSSSFGVSMSRGETGDRGEIPPLGLGGARDAAAGGAKCAALAIGAK